MALIQLTFEVHDDDTSSENVRKYREVVLAALRQLECYTPDEGRLADKLQYDAYRTEAAEYNESGDAMDNIADEID